MRITLLSSLLLLTACTGTDPEGEARHTRDMNHPNEHQEATEGDSASDVDPDSAPLASDPSPAVATLGAGCFWCVEAVLLQVEGVEQVVSGYMGGATADPTYKDICTGTTGHAEVVQVTYDPSVLPYEELLDWFFRLHDPTTLNRQGADRGTQYRSVIFFHSADQATTAREMIDAVGAAKIFDDPIVTEVTAASTFYSAEAYHQDYYALNSSQGYCRAVILPKLKKLGLKY
tara:strand:- start:3348 stop:4040 length:693 start_codon:yes stop_codon:yes gene_type:complete